MKILERLKKFFQKSNNVKLLIDENKKQSLKQDQTFKSRIREENNYDEISLTYIEEKILKIIKEFKKLFVKMLEEKNYTQINCDDYFYTIAIETKKFYPTIAQKIDRVLYYYTEEPDSEEKLEYMINLYQAIKEKIYEN